MPRFVVLYHAVPSESERPSHWDLMIEVDTILRTWALSAPPSNRGRVVAEQLPDHRQAYLEYEGPLSGGRGTVSRWDEGSVEIVEQSTDLWRLVFHGGRLQGPALVWRWTGDQRWRFELLAE